MKKYHVKKFSDVIIATGTNELRGAGSSGPDCRPKNLAAEIYHHIVTAIRDNPSVQIFVPAVLPTSNSSLNEKIDRYNGLLRDMARSHPNITYVAMGGFSNTENVLAPKFRVNDTSGIHINDHGVRVYGSRLKQALRTRHELPILSRRGGSGISQMGRGRGGRGRGRDRRSASGNSREHAEPQEHVSGHGMEGPSTFSNPVQSAPVMRGSDRGRGQGRLRRSPGRGGLRAN